MKRTGIFYLATIAIFMASQASAQSYTEIFTDGWGQGRRFTRPCFTDLDNDGLLDLLLGDHEVGIHHLEQNAVGSLQFLPISTSFSGIDAGSRPAPTITELDDDERLDLIIGMRNGTISHYEQDSPGSLSFYLVTENFNGIDVEGYATPGFTDLDQDDLLDLIVGKEDGTLSHYEQNESGSAEFSLVADSFNVIDVGYISTPSFTDLDGDGLLDMIVGVNLGHLHHYEQVSQGTTEFYLVSDSLSGIDVGAQACPAFADPDNDGLLDLIIGSKDATLYYYVQDAIGSRGFSLVSETFNDIDLDFVARPCFTDLLEDGLLDMIIGESGETLFHYRQNAVGSLEFTLISESFQDIITDGYSAPAYADINGDGLEDLFVGCYNGGIRYFQAIDNTGIEPESQDPASSAMIRVFPNPFHTSTQIRYTLQEEAKIQITIYTLLGQKVGVLEDNDRGPGTYTLTWDGTDAYGNALAGGSYICRIQAGPHREFVKIMLLK